MRDAPMCAIFCCRLPLHVIQPADFTFREFAAARARISFASRFDLVFDLVFPGLDFLVLSPSLPFFGCSLVSLVGALAFLLLSSLGRCCWWMFAAVGLSLFAWSLFLVSACPVLLGGRVKKNNYFTSSDPHHDIRFVTGKSSGILSDISSGIRSGISSGILPGISSGLLSGICSGISSDILSAILSGKSSGKHSGTLSGIPCCILSGISELILSGISSGILSGISSGILSDILSGVLSGISSGSLSDMLSGVLSGISSGILSGC